MTKGNKFAGLGAIRGGEVPPAEPAAPAPAAPEPMRNLQFRLPQSLQRALQHAVLDSGLTQEEYMVGLLRVHNADEQVRQRAEAEARQYRRERRE